MRRALNLAFALLLAALGIATAGSSAHAAFPDQPIHMIVPFDPGGGTDVISRFLAQKMGAILGQQFVIENKPGAAGTLGTAYVAKSKPDGYTLVPVVALAHTTAVAFYPDIPYDPVKNFTAIGAIGDGPYMLLINPQLPAKTLSDFIALVKANPGKYNAGSPGIGSAPHLALEYLDKLAGMNIVHVPYKGSGPALNDLVAGFTSAEIEGSAAYELVKAGKIRALAITGTKRSPVVPDVPTFAEAGLPQFDVQSHWGLIGPAGMPADVVATLNNALNKALSDPGMQTQLQNIGLVAAPGTPDAFESTIKSEATRWAEIIKEANIKP